MEHDHYDPTRRYPPGKFLNMISGSASFALLELILDPTRHPPLPIQDAVLVSMDLESRVIADSGRQITQVGIVSLDTRILAVTTPDDSRSLVHAVQSRAFSIHPKRASPKAWAPRSLWASPEKIEHDEVCDKIREILLQDARDVVLMGHAIHSDRSLLMEVFSFDIKQVTSITTIIDTGRMICNGYDFGIRYNQLHNAGNDAMFTMKGLLLMFCNWKYQKGRHLWNTAENAMFDVTSSPRNPTGDQLWDYRLDVLTNIARASWPVPEKTAPCRPAHNKPSLPRNPEADLLSSGGILDLMQLFEGEADV